MAGRFDDHGIAVNQGAVLLPDIQSPFRRETDAYFFDYIQGGGMDALDIFHAEDIERQARI